MVLKKKNLGSHKKNGAQKRGAKSLPQELKRILLLGLDLRRSFTNWNVLLITSIPQAKEEIAGRTHRS